MKTLDPCYTLPGRTFFSIQVIPNAKALRKAQTQSVVLQTRPLYESHTSTHLAEELTNAVTEWNLKRPNVTLPVTTDNAANILSVIHEADGPRPQTSCFAHVANLTAKKAVSINLVSRLLGKVRKVVTFFHKSTTAQHVLTVKQNMLNLQKHKLIHNVVTRWNTIREMLERFTEQQPAIYSALLDKHMKKSIKDISMLTDSDQKLAELIQLFKPLKTVNADQGCNDTLMHRCIIFLRYDYILGWMANHPSNVICIDLKLFFKAKID